MMCLSLSIRLSRAVSRYTEKMVSKNRTLTFQFFSQLLLFAIVLAVFKRRSINFMNKIQSE